MPTRTQYFEVDGFRTRTRTSRRFAVVTTRREPFVTEDGATLKPYIAVIKRTDSIATARKELRYRGLGIRTTIVDLVTGEEVK